MKTLKNLIATGIISAGLVFGAINKSSGQNYEVFNHDEDEFFEEKIGFKKMPAKKIEEITAVYYSDKNNDNFHEHIRVWNCRDYTVPYLILEIEDFYIDKSTGLINYACWQEHILKRDWNKIYANKLLIDLVRNVNPAAKQTYIYSFHNLTQQDIYNLPKIFGRFGERIKRLMNVGESENLKELENFAEQEYSFWYSP